MTPWQQAQQIRYKLRERLWGGVTSGADPVFGTVLVSPGAEEELTDERVRFPFVWVNDAGAEFGPEDRDQLRLYEQAWELTMFHGNENDGGGQALMLGANRSGGRTSSKGRGIMELGSEELLDTLASLGPADAMSLRMMAKSKARPVRVKRHGYLIAQAYSFSTRASNQRIYPNVTRFAAVGGTGDITFSWFPAPDRFDLVDIPTAYVIRVDSGGTPPTTPTGGTGGTTASKSSTGVVFATATGTYGVSIFARYDDSGADPPAIAATNVFSSVISLSGVGVL